jgi:hypothetical protein
MDGQMKVTVAFITPKEDAYIAGKKAIAMYLNFCGVLKMANLLIPSNHQQI